MSKTREQIFDTLKFLGPLPVSNIAEQVGTSAQNVRFHLGVLEHKGLVTREDGKGGTIWRLIDGDEQVQVFGNAPAGNAECHQIMGVLADGRMFRNEIAQVTGISPKRVTYLLHHMKKKGLVDMEGEKNRATWGVASERGPGRKNHAVSLKAALEEQRKTAVGRFLTQPAGVSV